MSEPSPIPPTAEQAPNFDLTDVLDRDGSGTRRIGKAHRRKRQLEALLAQRLLSVAEYTALKHYRHHADMADRSPIADSIATLGAVSGGRGTGASFALINAVGITSACERAAGDLALILRAVIVDDHSLSQYAQRHGTTEYARGNGTQIAPLHSALRIAELEMKFAAGRVAAELSA